MATLATACPHTDRPMKARGLCKSCWSREMRAGWKKGSAAQPAKPYRFQPGDVAGIHVVAGQAAGLVKARCTTVFDVGPKDRPGKKATCQDCIDAVQVNGVWYLKGTEPKPEKPKRAPKVDAADAAYIAEQAAGIVAYAKSNGGRQCPECGKAYSNPSNLNRHVRTAHGEAA